jgi:hypothetical protein
LGKFVDFSLDFDRVVLNVLNYLQNELVVLTLFQLVIYVYRCLLKVGRYIRCLGLKCIGEGGAVSAELLLALRLSGV